jgi:hypothetical protein
MIHVLQWYRARSVLTEGQCGGILEQQGKQSVKYRIVAISGYDPDLIFSAPDLRLLTQFAFSPFH